MRRIGLIAALWFSMSAASALGAEIEVTDADDIARAVALNDAVDSATASISACREAGKELSACFCANEQELAAMRTALDEIFSVRPEWRGQQLFLADTGGGQSLTLFLDAIAESAAPPDCN